ncbi:GNAT family N-acetyltransferase [Streptomyces sp. TP-A0356]|uniref:GNAT family N-acetyltransferase n=1 Tax=Streptomyces sp. TP-A0356 TaxID=1359208 RepID=UPI001F301BFE|nr:GNAT family N-acetyltransferase [Streptomyces sp. TP-A0356]
MSPTGSTGPGGGRGLATRAVLVVSRYAASEGGKDAVIRVEPDNAASAAVAQRAGFTPGKRTHGEDGTRLDWYIRDLCNETSDDPAAPSRHEGVWQRVTRDYGTTLCRTLSRSQNIPSFAARP